MALDRILTALAQVVLAGLTRVKPLEPLNNRSAERAAPPS